MALFRRRPAAPANPTGRGGQVGSTGHAGDDRLLAEITQRSDIDAPRHWIHYLYVADEAAARSAATVVGAAGWTVTRVGEAAGDRPSWLVLAETHAVTTPTAVREARLFFEGVAHTHDGGDYDGWEASL